MYPRTGLHALPIRQHGLRTMFLMALVVVFLMACGDSKETGSQTPSDPVDVVADTATPTDTGAETEQIDPVDTGMSDSAVKDIAVPPVLSCNPAGAWTMQYQAVPAKACGQNANQLTYIVERLADGTLVGTLPEMKEPTPVITVTPVASESGCAIALTMTAAFVFPADTNGVVDTVTSAQVYNVTAEDGVITGTGTVHMTTVTDAGVYKVDCKTPIEIAGQFVPSKD